MNRVRIGMLGTSHVHAITYAKRLAIHPQVELMGICDNDGGAVAEFARQKGIRIFNDPSCLLAERPQVVFICTENTRHIGMFRAAAAAKVDVICEKPIATTVEELREMVDTAKKNGIRLMTTFPNRYIHSYRRACREYAEGKIGDLLGVKATNKGEMVGGWFVDPTLSGGGCMIDHTVHVADLMNHMLGCAPVSVRASCAHRLYPELQVEDVALVSFQYENGVFVTLNSSWSHIPSFPYARDLTMHIIGSKGSLMVDYFAEVNRCYPLEGRAYWSYDGEDKDQMMIDDLVACYQNHTAFDITGEDGFNSAMVALAAYRSARENRTVRISEMEGYAAR